MESTLVINPGSASRKYALVEGGRTRATVRYESTRDGFDRCARIDARAQTCTTITEALYRESLRDSLAGWRADGLVNDAEPITRVGVRIVAPHTYTSVHRIVNDRYLDVLARLAQVAPLHVPAAKDEIDAARALLPGVPIVGVSDSAFHTTMPPFASLYSVPEADREALQLYRFGYHGLSVASVVRQYSEAFGRTPARALVVHAGSGVSVTALRDGASVDTTMGFSPASGLIMGSRGGDIDGAALLHIMRGKGLSIDAAESYLHTCGLRGFLGVSDLRVILSRAERGDRGARAGLDAFYYHLHKAMHAFAGILGGVDTIILTGTASERNPAVRVRILETFEKDAPLDNDVNDTLYERMGVITMSRAVTEVVVIPTDEMGEIARVAHAVSD